MPIGSVTTDKAPSATAPVPPPTVGAVTTSNAVTTQDSLTNRPRSFQAFTTVAFTGSADVALATPTASQTVRLVKLMFSMTEEATLSAAGDVLLTIYDNGIATGLQVIYYVPAAAVTGIGAEIIPMDLGDGWVSKNAGGVLTVHADHTLTAGKFLVTAIGNFEDEVR